MDESIQTIRTENADSLEIGTAGKGGAVKVYGSFDKVEEFKQKITNAAAVRAFAQAQIQVVA